MGERFTSASDTYEVDAPFAEGASGLAYRATSATLGRRCFLKQLKLAGTRDWKTVELFERELAAATAICRVIVAEHDWLFPPSEGERLARFAGAPLERIAGAGHAVWVECDDMLAQRTLAALAASLPGAT